MGWPSLTTAQNTVMVLGLNTTLATLENADVWNDICRTTLSKSDLAIWCHCSLTDRASLRSTNFLSGANGSRVDMLMPRLFVPSSSLRGWIAKVTVVVLLDPGNVV